MEESPLTARVRVLLGDRSIDDFAIRSGIPRATLYSWRTGTRVPDIPGVLKLLRACGYPDDDDATWAAVRADAGGAS